MFTKISTMLENIFDRSSTSTNSLSLEILPAANAPTRHAKNRARSFELARAGYADP